VPDGLISDAMRAAVGRELRVVESFPISASDIRRWAQAVYYPDPPPARYWDDNDPSVQRRGGIVAPEEFNPFAWMTADGPPRSPGVGSGSLGPEASLGIEPPPTSFLLNGGLSATYTGVGMRPGDVIRSVTTLAEYRERSGRLGLMLFTVTEDRWTNQAGEPVKSAQSTLIRY
jgi:hypothetical protein